MPSPYTRAALREKAKSGRVDDIFNLAQSYDFNRPKDKRAAIRWYKKPLPWGMLMLKTFLVKAIETVGPLNKITKKPFTFFFARRAARA